LIKFILKILLILTVIITSSNYIIFGSDSGWNSIEDGVALKIGSPKAFVNLEEMNVDASNNNVVPIIKNDRTLLPIRFISESFGAKVDWDSQTNTAIITYNNSVAKIKLNSDEMYVNSRMVRLDVPAEILNDRIYIPLRRLSEDVLNKKVFYDNEIIILTDNQKAFDRQFLTDLNASFKDNIGRLNYMIYYSKLDTNKIETAKGYDLVILHPLVGDITREQVQEIRRGADYNDPNDDVIVLGYISIGEDLRTCSLTDKEFATDIRFKGDGTGPRVDPRGPMPNGGGSLLNIATKGMPSTGGSGFASYYLDDNNYDGIPDKNKYFKGAFVNAGDPAWFDVVNNMTIDSYDKMPGLREILSDDFGRGLGCDGVFLDTIDTCAPNSYTDSNSPNQTEFEWTSPGFSEFIGKVRGAYKGKYILQNRGLFFFDSRLPQYKFCTRKNIDFMMFESYRLDSNADREYSDAFYRDNKYIYMPKLMAEANRPDGFKVLSLGYAAGKEKPLDTLFFKSQQGLPTFLEDIRQTQEIAGFNHYITDALLIEVNNFVLLSPNPSDNTPPIWSSTYNSSKIWPPDAPTPRIGVQQAIPQTKGVLLRWDVALDKNKVKYVAYYQTKPFDFENDPKLTKATKRALITNLGDGYENGVTENTYPYQFQINNLVAGETYYFVIRAVDSSLGENEDDNKVVLTAVPLN